MSRGRSRARRAVSPMRCWYMDGRRLAWVQRGGGTVFRVRGPRSIEDHGTSVAWRALESTASQKPLHGLRHRCAAVDAAASESGERLRAAMAVSLRS